MSTDNADQDDVAGHFQLAPETFDDDAVRNSRHDAPTLPTVDAAGDEDDVAGHVRTDPNAVEDDGDVDGGHGSTI